MKMQASGLQKQLDTIQKLLALKHGPSADCAKWVSGICEGLKATHVIVAGNKKLTDMGKSPEQRVSKDKNFATVKEMMKQIKKLKASMKTLEALVSNDGPTPTDEPDSREILFYMNPLDIFRDNTRSTVLEDILGHLCSASALKINDIMSQLRDSTQGFEGDESKAGSWKAGLDDCDLEELLAVGSKTLFTLDGKLIKTNLSTLQQDLHQNILD